VSIARLVGCAVALAAAALLAPAAQAQETKPPAASQIEQRVKDFIGRLEAARKEQGVVGAAIVVADGDRIVGSVGLGVRDLETAVPVTEDTVFAIGSVTKQFTAVAVALSVSEGKMRFEDHPRRFVPQFRLQDPEADAKLDLIDLLAHRSGLERSDLPWLAAPFTPKELFELAYRAKPAARLREKFHYNATMYALAGAAVARAHNTTYERFMTERFLTPLGMSSTTLTLDGLTGAANRALGYAKVATGAPTVVKPIDLAPIAPGGSINSTARDMGAWLRFLNTRGRIDGNSAIAPAVFARLFERHQKIAPGLDHGLGFFLHAKDGALLAEHGGNVPGFSAQVVLLPERGLSFALLTNQDMSGLGATALTLFMETVAAPETKPLTAAAAPKGPAPPAASDGKMQPIAPEELVGQYYATNAGGFEVRKGEVGLVAVFPQQPPYPLAATGVNSFDLTGLSGFSLVFGKSAEALPSRVTAFLRQPPSHPGGNLAFLKRDDRWLARVKSEHGGPGKDLVGLYRGGNPVLTMEIVPFRGGVGLIVTGDPPMLLKELGTDHYRLDGLPDGFEVRVRRAGGGRVAGIAYQQHNIRAELALLAPAGAGDDPEARAILDKAVAAVGGAAALDRLVSIVMVGRAAALTHGLDGRAEDVIVPGKRLQSIEVGAFNKTVWKTRILVGPQGMLVIDHDGERTPLTGKVHRASQFFAVPHPLYRWKERFATVVAAGEAPVNGEEAFAIELTPRDLAPTKLYISKASFVVLREEQPAYLGDDLLPEPVTIDYADHRLVGGLRLPHAGSFALPLLGRFTLNYDSIWLDKAIDPKAFEASR
jgi:CubicO group peptidase (beta-lactamase class C family)